MKKISFLMALSMFISLITSCAKNVSHNTYEAGEAGVASKVVHGVIIGKRAVKIDANSGAGGLAGAAAGTAGGSAIGGSDHSNIAGAIGGCGRRRCDWQCCR